jgi:hypothetical protein
MIREVTIYQYQQEPFTFNGILTKNGWLIADYYIMINLPI